MNDWLSTCHLLILPVAATQVLFIVLIAPRWNRNRAPLLPLSFAAGLAVLLIATTAVEALIFQHYSNVDLGQDIVFSVEVVFEKLLTLQIFFAKWGVDPPISEKSSRSVSQQNHKWDLLVLAAAVTVTILCGLFAVSDRLSPTEKWVLGAVILALLLCTLGFVGSRLTLFVRKYLPKQ